MLERLRMSAHDEITIRETVLAHYPTVQGAYLFGTYGTEDVHPGSDVDVALLLPPAEAAMCGPLMYSRCHDALTRALRRDVDLINARRVSTVFQKEIITSGRMLIRADAYAVDEFEMLVFSYYQKLNEERAGILEAFLETGRAYDV